MSWVRVTMKGAVLLGLLSTVLGFHYGWSSFLDDDIESWNLDRRSSCVGQSGKCFASGQCCRGFVCAAFDDLFGKNPEVPGYCVREKDLEPCESSQDCKDGSRCKPLGRRKMLYCIHEDDLPEEQEQHMGRYPGSGKKGGLSAKCETNDDCKGYTNDGLHKMCCQEVRRYRQKAKKMCDRITPVSVCIAKRK